jgi:hypothetical protein
MNSKAVIPSTELELLDLAKRVSDRWRNEPNFVLSYMTSSDFDIIVTDFGVAISTRSGDGNSRASITVELASLDKTIDGSSKYVKAYLDEKYDTKAAVIAKYGVFGIEKVGNIYKIPSDRNERCNALSKIPAALTAEGFATKKYGAAFWNPIITRYTFLCNQAITTDGAVSVQVGNKLMYKKQIKQVLSALHALIKIQNPDNYKAVLRSWGYQKEKM